MRRVSFLLLLFIGWVLISLSSAHIPNELEFLMYPTLLNIRPQKLVLPLLNVSPAFTLVSSPHSNTFVVTKLIKTTWFPYQAAQTGMTRLLSLRTQNHFFHVRKYLTTNHFVVPNRIPHPSAINLSLLFYESMAIMQIGFNSLLLFVFVLYLFELCVARKIWQKTRQRNRLNHSSPQKIIVIFDQSPSHHKFPENTTLNGKPIGPLPRPYQEFTIPQNREYLSSSSWVRVSFGICMASIFLIAFIIISFLLQPSSSIWAVYFLPILIPLPFLTLPSLFQMRSLPSFFLITSGLGLGFLFFLFL